ncbi:homoserine kinase [Lysobacter pythonis]|uniref:Homoserine kinase n=1 Tax=Solilutibacter pythonis TaxID=2483112 RepID=A0A3M2I0E4_9GAMM|nr:homoserine kinase [Lysobacter pythonis]RMH93099.1 homoserine kinase [Lysobacter pythonis]
MTLSPPIEARAFAPASVGNIGVGFDILGHAIDGPGDHASVRRIAEPVVQIAAVRGNGPGIASIPLDPARNTAGMALMSLREALALPFGFELVLEKGIPIGSGLGGSAASVVAALVAANALLETPLAREALYPFALDGESIASGSRHGDNVAPMLLGGVALCTHQRMIPLAAPDWLHAAVVHPDQVLETRRSRAVLADPYPLAQIVTHCEHLALFLTGLARGERQLIAEGLRDGLVEPRRASLIPGFEAVKQAALDADALGASISGGGPSVFGWFDGRDAAERAAVAMRQAFAARGVTAHAHVSPVNAKGARLT